MVFPLLLHKTKLNVKQRIKLQLYLVGLSLIWQHNFENNRLFMLSRIFWNNWK